MAARKIGACVMRDDNGRYGVRACLIDWRAAGRFLWVKGDHMEVADISCTSYHEAARLAHYVNAQADIKRRLADAGLTPEVIHD